MIFTWTWYNIESDYLDTKLGAIWIALQPVLMTLIYSAVFSLLLNRSPRGNVPYVSFFLAGMILWQFFSTGLMQASSIIAVKANLMSQIKFPKETLVFVAFLEKMVDFSVAFLILIALNLFYGFYPTWYYLYVPVLLLIFFSLTLGIMLMLSVIGVFLQDTPQIVSVGLRFLFYFSGVLISGDMLPKRLADLLSFNPLFYIVETFRGVVLYSEQPDLLTLVLWLGIGVVFMLGGFAFFKSYDGKFADYK